MAITVLVVGVAWLIATAYAVAQRSALEKSWRAIAIERRALHEMRCDLDTLAGDLTDERLRLEDWEHRLVQMTEHALRQGDR